MAAEAGGLAPVEAIALVGALGIGAQWLAWRLNQPAIVLMLAVGLIVGPGLGLFIPERDLGALVGPAISVAVAVILFEGGLSLHLHGLADAAKGVRRLVILGAPLGWLFSALALHFGAGLGWESSAVFGGIMVVTGPTVIAPLLRQAKLAKRPANLLQWEAIVNDPVGALAAVIAFGLVSVLQTDASPGAALGHFSLGLVVATLLGLGAGRGLVLAFRSGGVPEFLKVPVLFSVLIAVFAVSDVMLHESGLLAVTVMGLIIANSGLPSYEELRRFKEHATVLLVSGVFILLAAGIKLESLAALDWRAALFVALVIGVARPATVLLALAGTGLPWREKLLVALTGPRGVVLMAVAGLFGERLAALGIADAHLIGPLAFVLVAATVIVHGFALTPLARALGLSMGNAGGVLLIGGSPFATALGLAFARLEVPVMVSDPNMAHLRGARTAGLPIFYGDILSEAADNHVELIGYSEILAATDNDAYNTLVTSDLAPEFGRRHVWQTAPEKALSARHALPSTFGGRRLGSGLSAVDMNQRLATGWRIAATRLTAEFTLEHWRAMQPEGLPIAIVSPGGIVRFLGDGTLPKNIPETRLISLVLPNAGGASEA